MARPLIIDAKVRAEIATALQRAEANPISAELLAAGAVEPTTEVLSLADRKPGFERPESESVIIPVGYRAAISVEEQPFGLARHLSVSVERVGMTPHPNALEMIADEFGMPKSAWITLWLEEFEPGHHAVNVLTRVQVLS